jgi:integration host factor subunit alpha|tara:strand:- start:7966 stop:8244 length:279 start_codon:yes stop_codon:yes gene_type:complete
MTRAVLSNKVASTLDITHEKADVMVSAVLDCVKQGLVKDKVVIIRGFGRFRILDKVKRYGRNPKTGEAAVITARQVPNFRSSKLLKNIVNTK